MEFWICLLVILFTVLSADAKKRRRTSWKPKRRTRKPRRKSWTRKRGWKPSRKWRRRRKPASQRASITFKGNHNNPGIKQVRKRGGGRQAAKISFFGSGNNPRISQFSFKRATTEKVRCEFDWYDLNMDGVCPYDEFIQASSYLNKEFDTDVLFRIFDNHKGDGMFGKEEFMTGAQIFTNFGIMGPCNFLLQ